MQLIIDADDTVNLQQGAGSNVHLKVPLLLPTLKALLLINPDEDPLSTLFSALITECMSELYPLAAVL